MSERPCIIQVISVFSACVWVDKSVALNICCHKKHANRLGTYVVVKVKHLSVNGNSCVSLAALPWQPVTMANTQTAEMGSNNGYPACQVWLESALLYWHPETSEA